MTEQQLDRVHELKEDLARQLRGAVRRALAGEDPEVANSVLEQLSEQFRLESS